MCKENDAPGKTGVMGKFRKAISAPPRIGHRKGPNYGARTRSEPAARLLPKEIEERAQTLRDNFVLYYSTTLERCIFFCKCELREGMTDARIAARLGIDEKVVTRFNEKWHVGRYTFTATDREKVLSRAKELILVSCPGLTTTKLIAQLNRERAEEIAKGASR